MSKRVGPRELALRQAREAQSNGKPAHIKVAPSPAASVELVIPDPRKQPVPAGWFEQFAPVAESLAWDGLDEAEAQLLALASYIDSFEGDVVEFEKALRIIEWRRGVLLGEPQHGGDRKSEGFQVSRVELDVSPPTANRYRTIARNWDAIWLHLLKAKERREVTQTQILRVANHEERKATPALPDGTFRVIYADPPWSYGDSGLQQYGHASFHYPPMSIAELCALPVADKAQDDAVLFMWVTSPLLFEAAAVVKAWGFQYKTSFVWDKVKHNFGHYSSRACRPAGTHAARCWHA